MVRGVLVQIREAQHKFEHTVALIGVRFIGVGFELLHRRERVGEEPLQILGAQRFAALAVRERLLGANRGFIEKMIQTKLRAN
jgi:hypothetical protein